MSVEVLNNKVQSLQCVLTARSVCEIPRVCTTNQFIASFNSPTYHFQKIGDNGRIQRKEYLVKPIEPASSAKVPAIEWLRSDEGFNAINDALKFFGFDFQLENVFIEWRNYRFYIYNAF